ncbi:MAG: hypothetical protein P4L99_05240 [Chthoniobacter sp.]|nr:hypothetical protein [Chthoniobacter sp.]
MSSRRRERIRRLGRTRFILLYGVCGWGLPFGLVMATIMGLPAFLLLRVLNVQVDPSHFWLYLIFPILISAVGGFQWGRGMWDVLFEPLPPTSSSSSST